MADLLLYNNKMTDKLPNKMADLSSKMTDPMFT